MLKVKEVVGKVIIIRDSYHYLGYSHCYLRQNHQYL